MMHRDRPSADVRSRTMANNTSRTRTTRRRTVIQKEGPFAVYGRQIESAKGGGTERTILLEEITAEDLQQRAVTDYPTVSAPAFRVATKSRKATECC